MSNIFVDTLAWLTDPVHWSGSGGIATRLLEHLQYSGLVLVIAAAIAVPVGLFIGHTGHGRVVAVAFAGPCGHFRPSACLSSLPCWLEADSCPGLGLVILTVPPLLAGTYAGISSVDPKVVDGAGPWA
ncbi:hypothetical protein AHiyo8_52780 [Arthrobacter sp. Hiyo8]|nr:hypothetical protein AHiyo8_52780 [Arthrobacter sp. Hiyo8]